LAGGGSFGGFSSGFCEEDVWFEFEANTKTAGANKVLKSRKGVHNIAFDQC